MKRKYLLKSSIRTAKLSRLIAKAVDLFIVLIMAMMFYPLGLIFALCYLAISDFIYGGQSVGKRFIGFSVISLEDGSPCSLKQSIIRNLPFLIPLGFAVIFPWGVIICTFLILPLTLLEVYLLFKLDSGHRLGDVMADTTVIGNDPDRVDIRKAKESWFKNSEGGMSPCNKTLM